MGLAGTPAEPPAVVEPDDAEPLPALTLINEATDADAITPIPTVGPGAAKVIFDNRPSGGYPSLDALPKAIFAQPYRCDLTQITSWAG
jgi:DNA uptake protein ComE-like DNA-binding protein